MILTALLVTGTANLATAHEFWIEPLQYQVDTDDMIEARFRNGEELDGVELAFFDRRSARLQMSFSDDVVDFLPRNGDRPAIAISPRGDGLHILLHETKPSALTYKNWEKFAAFAAHKDFPDIESRHLARGLPRDGFREEYSRHAKALIGVGTGDGADAEFGLTTEIVALSNPYSKNFTQNMRVYVAYRGAKRANVQVELFDKAPDGTVTVTRMRTDPGGFAEFQTTPGHVYLVDSVVLEEPAQGSDHAWRTYWAALTFAVPSR